MLKTLKLSAELLSLAIGLLLGAVIVWGLHTGLNNFSIPSSHAYAQTDTSLSVKAANSSHLNIEQHACANEQDYISQDSILETTTQPQLALTQVLEQGLTPLERRWLSDNPTYHPNIDFNANPEIIGDIIDKIMHRPNDATRRYLVQVLKQLEITKLEEIVYQFANADRAIDQETAIELAVTINQTEYKPQLIKDLLVTDLITDAQLQLISALNNEMSKLNLADFYSQLIDVYQNSTEPSVKTAITHTLTQSDFIRESAFHEIFALMQNDVTLSAMARLQSIQSWVAAYSERFSEQQKYEITQYSEQQFSLANHYEQKKLALKIGGAI
ncbi:hypothetical protein C2869_03015 [Saccharobesus litoralis]|uniref:Uncharacterized protein n=1 Tax=Saccharobesus litoralis TaxID=2172099 RepID=A0A2S0VMM6_9ALTE|nr:hypothetical protein [Saccharobesus litoralis]AWB65468.1 hypothetical protein C2869_03015 [Saccharobesus litoralis]